MAQETVDSGSELNELSAELEHILKAELPKGSAGSLTLDRKHNRLILTADISKLSKYRCDLALRPTKLELTTPKKTFRLSLRGCRVEPVFVSGQFIIAVSSPGTPDSLEGGYQDDLGKAASRMFRVAEGGKRVFATRAMNAIADLTERNAQPLLESAATAASDWELLVRALSAPEVVEPISASDPLAGARLRGLQSKRRLLESEGGTLSASKVAHLLGISRQGVDKRRLAGRLLGINFGRHGYQYPAWQFDHGGVLRGLEPVLKTLASHDEWMKLAFFLNANDRLQAKTPLDRLRSGAIAPVVDAARAYGAHGAA